MNVLGVRLNLLIGPEPLAFPAPPPVLEALTGVEVTHTDRGPSGFRLSFATGRSGPAAVVDDPLVLLPMLTVNTRVVLTAIFDVRPVVIMDGIVTKRNLLPGDEPGQGQLILDGRDLSVVLDREVAQVQHPAQDETVIATKIALAYAKYGIVPDVRPPLFLDPAIPIDRTPQQNETDWRYLERMACRHGYVTYVKPGPAPFVNRLYWGPPEGLSIPQKALSVNLGPESNVTGVSFGQDARAPKLVQGKVKDRLTGKTLPVLALFPTRPPLGLVPETLTQARHLRKTAVGTSGMNLVQAMAAAQSEVDVCADETVTVRGTLDSAKYNGVLEARSTVDLRGAGFSFSGTYLVRTVTHNIAGGRYTQDFTLSRAEMGAKLPVVRTL